MGDEFFFQRLDESWNTDNRFFSRAAFLTDRFLDKDAEPDLRSHLARLYALDNLQEAISSLIPVIKLANQEADGARKATKASGQDLQNLVNSVEAAESKLGEIRTQVERLRTDMSDTADAIADGERQKLMREELIEWKSRRDGIVADAERIVGSIPTDVSLISFLRAAESGAIEQLNQLTEERARLSERVSSLEASLERLHTSGGQCPICRRPLDDANRTFAEEAHLHDREVATMNLEVLEVEPFISTSNALRQLVSRAEALGEPQIEVEVEPINLDVLTIRYEETKVAFEKVLGDARQAEIVLADLQAQQVQMEAELTSKSSVSLYKRAAALETAKLALEGTVSGVLDAQLGPVSSEVNRRWETVFPDRAGLRLDSTGHIVRFLDGDLEDIDFSSFSSGEKVVAKLLLRLATLTSTTNVPFCWIDEPLEHLDPDARLYVAQTLAYLSSDDALSQIVVTTYEQDLAVHLAGTAHEQVRLEFLKTTPVSLS